MADKDMKASMLNLPEIETLDIDVPLSQSMLGKSKSSKASLTLAPPLDPDAPSPPSRNLSKSKSQKSGKKIVYDYDNLEENNPAAGDFALKEEDDASFDRGESTKKKKKKKKPTEDSVSGDRVPKHKQVDLIHAQKGAASEVGSHIAAAEKKFMKTYESWAVIKKIASMPLDLSIECKGLPNIEALGGFFSKISPFGVVYMGEPHNGGPPEEWGAPIGFTEIINNEQDPKFVDSTHIDCLAEDDVKRFVKVDMYAADLKHEVTELSRHKFIGSATTVIQKIIDATGQCLQLKLAHPKKQNRGTITFLLDTITLEDVPKKVTLDISVIAGGTIGNPKKIYGVVSRGLRKNHWARVYKSESTALKNFTIKQEFTLASLAAGEEDRAFRVELFKDAPMKIFGQDFMGHQKLLGFGQVSVSKLKDMKQGQSLQWWSVNGGLQPGGLRIAGVEHGKNSFFFQLEICA